MRLRAELGLWNALDTRIQLRLDVSVDMYMHICADTLSDMRMRMRVDVDMPASSAGHKCIGAHRPRQRQRQQQKHSLQPRRMCLHIHV